MLLQLRRSTAVVFLLLVVLVSAAHAAKPAGNFTRLGLGVSLQPLKVGRAIPNAACNPGETRPPIGYLPYILPPEDRYFTLIDPSSCTVCTTPASIEITAGHMGVYFPSACTMTITVSVVGAMPSPADPTCLIPNEASVICPAVGYLVSAPAAGGYDVVLPLPPGCCIHDKAFLRYDFVDGDCDVPGIFLTDAPCNPCQSWNFYGPFQDDICDVLPYGNLYMFADAECCNPVPGLHKTWGSIKNIYR